MSIRTNITALLLFFVFQTSVFAGELPKPQGDEAIFRITSKVKRKDPPRFGVNIETPTMSHWNTEPWHNQWWLAPNPNPITARIKVKASGGGADFIEANDGWKMGYWDVFRDGFFEGGQVVVYRYKNGKAKLVREGTVKQYQASKTGPNRLTFTEKGPKVQKGDEFWLTVTRMDIPRESTRPWNDCPWWLVNGFQLEQGKEKKFYDAGVRLALSPDTPPRGGGASLAVTIPDMQPAEPVRVGYWLLSAEKEDWPRFREGKTYTVRMWLKQKDMAQGNVEVRVASIATQTLAVGNEWQEYSVEFQAALPKHNGERFDIGSSEAGTLWIDNVTIVENDGPPAYGFYPEVIDTLRRFNPSTIRLWSLQENRGYGKTLKDALGRPEDSNLIYAEVGGAKPTNPVGLHQELELCDQVGTQPWIITSTMFSPQEYTDFIEYLAGPIDTPFGALRAQWGQEKPWTEVFDHITVEIGNEVWNSMFAPQHFNNRAEEYGAFAEQCFKQMKASPHFNSKKYTFLVNGWTRFSGMDGYGPKAIMNAPSADGFGMAYYTGGWDSVGLMKSDSMDESWMNILTYSRRMLLPYAQTAKASADQLSKTRRRPTQVVVYEAGPGYTLPGPGKFDIKEQREGKSLGQAINSLDSYMTNLAAGLGDQSFFHFKNGHYWASHNRNWDEHIIWKALGMRNTLLQGNLITAKAKKMVTLDLPETQADIVSQTNSADKSVTSFPALENMPMIDCYPFEQDGRYSIMLLSRRIDGPTPVTLMLPYQPQSAYTLYTLTADSPAAHNIDEELVKVQTQELEGMTKKFTVEVPPHSVLVLVNHKKEANAEQAKE